MNISDQAKSEVVTLLLERPIVAMELGFMAEDDFVALMHSIHRLLKRQSLTSLASVSGSSVKGQKRSYQDIIDLVRNAVKHGI